MSVLGTGDVDDIYISNEGFFFTHASWRRQATRPASGSCRSRSHKGAPGDRLCLEVHKCLGQVHLDKITSWHICLKVGIFSGFNNPRYANTDCHAQIKTLPKAQRTRGLSSYHKFKHKS